MVFTESVPKLSPVQVRSCCSSEKKSVSQSSSVPSSADRTFTASVLDHWGGSRWTDAITLKHKAQNQQTACRNSLVYNITKVCIRS
ncbi:hypothetical protein F7725_009528 [Dissostichus mawsoni]|uniref:Uncharacterized protein n=1 Tax=Dissostichus mawsoni TaxID=36200 RepID=A0A7J5XL79_DISMA|nr:hypothetical protein F7725_009528 [Dissostichus mawsoni]